jgi:cellulose synthase/poly-beta-1,6-N-acetylglucosamine synthase-like glycosyltransferase
MLSILIQFVFWSSVVALTYVYFGYPVIAFFMSRLVGRPINRESIEPTVSIIITAYNEEKNIRSKIENTLLIDYPKEKLEVIVASDGSTDRTDEIVQSYIKKGVKLFRTEGRAGKTTTQNGAVAQSLGDILLFSDATTTYPPDVLYALLPNFADESVGCVAGKLVYLDHSGTGVARGAKSYWSYESVLKQAESDACSLIGVSGCMYAVRRGAYIPLYPEACSDFIICTVLYRQGLRSIYEPSAVCNELTNSRVENEFGMRVRVISQTLTDLWINRDMLNPLRHGFYAIQLLSHKVLRYSVPVFLILMLLSSVILAFNNLFYAVVTLLEVCFYLVAIIAWALEMRSVRLGILGAPFYFVLANLSSVVGFYKFLRGERFVSWETVR